MWQQLIDFLYNNWFKIGLLVWLFFLVSGFGREWFKQQVEWIKLMFVDDDEQAAAPNAPSHKNAIMIMLTVAFLVGFLRKISMETSAEIPDIGSGWQLVLLTGLGIAAVKTSAQKLFENKWGNGTSTPPEVKK